MKKSRNICLALCCIQSFLIGFEAVGLQYCLQKMGVSFQTSQGTLGNLIALQYLSLMTVPMLFGPLSDRCGKRFSAAASCVFFALGSLIMVCAKSIAVLGVGIFLCGAGYGVCESTGVAVMFDLFPTSSDRKITFSQAVFSAGGVLSPFLLEYLMLRAGCDWKVLFYIILGGNLLLVAPVFFLFPTRRDSSAGQTDSFGRENRGVRHLLVPTILLLCICLFVSSGLENGYTFYVDLFAMDVVCDSTATALSLSLFWLINVFVRLLYSAFSVRSSRTVLLVSFGFSAVGIALLLICPSRQALLVISAVLGGLLALMWPVVQDQAMQEFPNESASVASIMSIPSGAGAVLVLIASGQLSDFLGVRAAYLCLVILALIGFGAYLSFCRIKRRGEKGGRGRKTKTEKEDGL